MIRQALFAIVIGAGATATTTSARALVGEAGDGSAFAPYTLMVLKRAPGGAGFCTGVVIGANVVLTAAHCVGRTEDTRVHFKNGDGGSELAPVAAIAVHPQYRADAPRTRERSIDLALVRTAAPLPSRFRAASIDGPSSLSLGERFRVAGFGVTREGTGATSGVLRAGVLAARAPLSSILLWAEDPEGRGFGACTGNSGGPIFAANSTTVVAITNWTTGQNRRGCGGLTQGALVAPQRAWIDGVIRGWGGR